MKRLVKPLSIVLTLAFSAAAMYSCPYPKTHLIRVNVIDPKVYYLTDA